MRSLCVAAFFISLLASSATAQQPIPIEYRVLDNNRLFLESDANRYMDDLHTYLWCINSDDAAPSEECTKYRRDGQNGADLVPSLRRDHPRGAYRIRYDPHVHSHPSDYVLNGKRKLTFFLNPMWLDSVSLAPKTCKWKIGETQLQTDACSEAVHEIELVPSADGSTFEYSGVASVNIFFADGSTQNFRRTFVTRDFLIIAMGDSFTAGEGNPSHNTTDQSPAEWMDYRCHRSAFSYPTIVATALAILDPRHSITLVHVACSGAESTAGLRLPYIGAVGSLHVEAYRRNAELRAAAKTYQEKFERLPPQISQVSQLLRSTQDGRRRRRPDLTLMSVGVNDMGIAAFLQQLALNDVRRAPLETQRNGPCPPTYTTGDTRKEFETPSESRLRLSETCLDKRIELVRTEIEQQINPRKTFLVSYIDPITNERGDVCGVGDRITLLDGYKSALFYSGVKGAFLATGAFLSGVPHLSHEEMDHARSNFVGPLLRTLESSALKNGWEWIAYNAESLEGRRGFCAIPSWYHTYRASNLRQGTDPGSEAIAAGTLHPNAFGQYFAAVRVLARLRLLGGMLSDHNIHALSSDEFALKKDKHPTRYSRGFAWQIWDWGSDPKNLSRYHKHRTGALVE